MPINPDLWFPRTWDEITGNGELKQFAHGQVNLFRIKAEVHGSNALVLGQSGTGKSATLRLAQKALLCKKLDKNLNPCHAADCCARDAVVGRHGLFVRNDDPVVETYVVDCANAPTDQLRRLREIADIRNGPLVIWLDEVHRLERQKLDEQLLIAMDTTTATWIASSTTIEGLELAFVNRFRIRLVSSAPPREEFIDWLAARCQDCGVQVDDPATLAVIAEGVECNGRDGLSSLSYARNRNGGILTQSLAEDFLDRHWSFLPPV